MNIKYLKHPDTKEKVYPITQSGCIIDSFSINDLEIDRLFLNSLSVSKHLKGMSYLNLQGLIHYHSKIKDYFNNIPEVYLSGYATEEYVNAEIANIDIPILNNTKTKEEVVNITDGVYYFTPDTKLIYVNGESYGGTITSEDVTTVEDSGILVQAAIFVLDYSSDTNLEFKIKPNCKYLFGQRTDLNISLYDVTNSNIVNTYQFEFTSGNVATTLTVPANVVWIKTPNIQPNKTYQVYIENNLGVIGEWSC